LRTVRTRAGNVRCRRVRMVAAKTSFHEITKVKRLAAAKPGRARGRETRRKAESGLQPRVMAASSRSRGIAMNTLEVIRMTKGRAMAVWTRATAHGVS
jgi:hypothetical protein